jgi:hypothetical protein
VRNHEIYRRGLLGCSNSLGDFLRKCALSSGSVCKLLLLVHDNMVKTFSSDLILVNIQATSVHDILSASRMKKTWKTKHEQNKNGEYLVIADPQ